MSFEETALVDLCEYEECDSHNDKTYQTSTTNDSTDYGVPLSVELSESLSKSQTPTNKQTSNCFVKASEIFLRIDSTITPTSDFISNGSSQSNENNEPNELENSEETIVFECKEKKNVIIRNDCVELQYENEFEDPNDEVDDGSSQVICKHNNSLDNDYEELFSEGIN